MDTNAILNEMSYGQGQNGQGQQGQQPPMYNPNVGQPQPSMPQPQMQMQGNISRQPMPNMGQMQPQDTQFQQQQPQQNPPQYNPPLAQQQYDLSTETNDTASVESGLDVKQLGIIPPKKSITKTLTDLIKEPLILLIIYIVFNLPQVKAFFVSSIPFLAKNNLYALLFIGVLMVVVFMVVKKFLL